MREPHREIQAEMKRLRACVLIPTFNNAGTLGRVVEEVLAYAPDVIVVNDGSTDSTADILAGFGDRITVVTHRVNRGKGAALRTGFTRATEAGFDYTVTLDSDGQHLAEDIALFADAIASHPGALIVGERDLSDVEINGKSSFANKFSNFWFCVQTGRHLRDTQTGFRAYPLRQLRGLGLLTSRYEAELELLVLAAWHGTDIVSIPIHVYYPPKAERVSHFRPGMDFARISLLNTLLCGAAILYGAPLRLWNALRRRRLFNGEFRPFTRRKGVPKEAATTLGRLSRSVYALTFFVVNALLILQPAAMIYAMAGRNTDRKKYRFHRALQRISIFLQRHFPGAPVTCENPAEETLDKPAIIICNHQSHLDLPVIMARHPRMVFLTNDWVWNNPFYGRLIRYAEYLPVSEGIETLLSKLRSLRDRGYSIVVFPEGTRSADFSIGRFHSGAFHIARELQMDIVPMVLHGAGHYLPKRDFMFRKGRITLRILPRIPYDAGDSTPSVRRASAYRALLRREYAALARRVEDAAYFRSYLLYRYAYRGWSTVARCKSALSRLGDWQRHIDDGTESARVRVVNSGIGVFALAFALVNKETEVYAFESDIRLHRIAAATPALPPNLHFLNAVRSADFETGAPFDRTYILDSPTRLPADIERGAVRIPLKS